jgi:hypothetical protein
VKALWIALGVLVVLGLLCCGGVVLFGRNTYNKVLAVNKEAKAYAESSLKAISEKWDVKELESRATPAFKASAASTLVTVAGPTKLGKLVSLDDLRMMDLKMSQDSAVGSSTKLDLEGTGVFQKGRAGVAFTLIKRDGHWSIDRFDCRRFGP